MHCRKEFKEGGEAEGKEKRQAERAQKQKEQKEREAKEKTEENENDDTWVAVPTKEEKMRQLFDPKIEINHEVRLLKSMIPDVKYLCSFLTKWTTT